MSWSISPDAVRHVLRSLSIAALAWMPAEALGCPVCYGWTQGGGNRAGFYWSAVLLSLLPFGLVGALALWLRRSLQASVTRGGGRDEPLLRGAGDGLEPAVHAHLVENILDVIAHRGGADVEAVRHRTGSDAG